MVTAMLFPSVRKIALQVARDRKTFHLDDVVNEAARQGNPAKYHSISSVVSTMAKEGLLMKGRGRGMYELPLDALENSEAPALSAGASAQTTSSTVGAVVPDTREEVSDDADHHPDHHRATVVSGGA